MIVSLSRAYAARGGTPVVDRVDRRIFSLTYFHDCLRCDFCHDSCCQYGATVELTMIGRLASLAAELEPYVEAPAAQWYGGNDLWDDPDYPGGWFTRTAVRPTPRGPRCVFASRDGRGCRLHAFALERGLPVHDLKPMACNLFPVLWDNGVLIVPLEIDDGTLICRDTGVTLYRSARNDLRHYFGAELIDELDGLERSLEPAAAAGLVPLPMAAR